MQNRRMRSLTPLFLIGAGVLFIAGAFFSQVFQNRSTFTEQGAGNSLAQPGVNIRVSIADAKIAYENGTAVFVDVRSSDSYDQGHIPGSLSIPLNELETRVGELDPGQWIITYCT